MRAIVLSQFGPPGELMPAEVPDPVPGPGQAVIAVEFASITFVETQLRSGHPPHPSMTPALPVVLGNGVGGTISAVGPGADPALAGQRVVATTGGSGGYAERAVVDAEDVISIPPELSTADAVALMAAAAVQRGETVLVEAAGGGVGTLLVQLAVGAGATVVAAAGAPGKL